MSSVAFDYEVPFGHRLMNHKGKCRFPHGHNYIFSVEIIGKIDPSTGMVKDFSEIKEAVRDLFTIFDHAFVLHVDDPFCDVLKSSSEGHLKCRDVDTEDEYKYLKHVPTKVVVLNCHPTAENLSSLVAQRIGALLKTSCAVKCFEQRDCSVESYYHYDPIRATSFNADPTIITYW